MLEPEVYKEESWEEAVRRLREEIPFLYPAWTDYNAHDPGITILELLVWLQQAQLFQIRQIGDRHRRKYTRLLGMERIPRMPGHTMVTVDAPEGVYLEAGSRFYADSICFETRESQMVTENAFVQFATVVDGRESVLRGDWLASGRDLSLFPFGEKPEVGARLEITLGRPLEPGVMNRLYIRCFDQYPVKRTRVRESAYGGYGFYPLGEICMEYLSEHGWREVELIRDETYGMMQDGSICFRLGEGMAAAGGRLRFVLKRCDYLTPPCIIRISLAMVEVWQQQTLNTIQVFDGDGFPEQRFDLEERQLYVGELKVQAGDVLQHGTREDVAPVLIDWVQTEDFDCSGPEDRHYRIVSGVLEFGDGFHGLMPEGRIQVSHQIRTLGNAGNIKAGTIRRLDHSKHPVCNEYDVTGGTDEETTEEMFIRFQEEQKMPKRGITFSDYETLVRQIPGLLIEDCSVYSLRPEEREIIIAVKPYASDGHGQLNDACKKNLYRYLEEKRLLGTRLELVSPEYYEISISCVVVSKVQYRNAGDMVETAVKNWIGSKRFGENLIYSELAGVIDALPCVKRIETLWLDVGSKGRRNPLGDVLLPPHGLFHLRWVDLSLIVAGEDMR